MRLKSFHGSTLNDAMRQVRDALGDNAIIVATRDDDIGGVRVTAAIDETPSPLAAVENEYDKNDQGTGSESIEIIATALLKHQVPTSLAERLLASATQFAHDDPVMALGAAFDTHLTFAPLCEEKGQQPLVLVGIPGAGKTLTTAKLATKSTLAKKQVAVISTDTERAGGMEQLSAFTRLLKLKLIEIEDIHALRDAIALQQTGTITLVDTPGINPFIQNEQDLIRTTINAAKGNAVLVLTADLDSMEAIDLANAFRSVGAKSLLFTRLDMTRRLGTILRVAFETKMPLTHFSLSHKVTEPPQAFNPITLARLFLPQHSETKNQTSGS